MGEENYGFLFYYLFFILVRYILSINRPCCNKLRGRVSLIHFDIDIFFVLCIFWFCNHLHTSCVVSIFDDDVCVSLFISHVLFFFFSLYTHVSCLFNLSLFFTWYLDVFCLVPFRKDKLKPSQVPNLLLAATSNV